LPARKKHKAKPSKKKGKKGYLGAIKHKKTDHAEFHKGFAFKARTGKHKGKWLHPDGTKVISDARAKAHNAHRRSQRTRSDAWAALKRFRPEVAERLSWRGFLRLVKGLDGDRTAIASAIGAHLLSENEEEDDWFNFIDDPDELGSWGDSTDRAR
jgi:hypothetical protein